MGKTISVTGKVLDPEDNANPCGLIAKSFFNDTYTMKRIFNSTFNDTIKIDEKNIAW